jgi:hypothetical protein
MEYIRKKISLENYTIRSIPKSVLITNSEGKTIIDEDNPKYFYGKIPDYKVDTKGDYILNSFGQKILNTINVDLHITQDIDDMGIFTDRAFVPSDTILPSPPPNFNSFSYGRLAGTPLNFYMTGNNTLSGNTDDEYLNRVKSYRVDDNGNPIYVPYLNTSDDSNNTFNGVIGENVKKITYKIAANPIEVSEYEQNIITEIKSGIEFTTYKKEFIQTIDEYGDNISFYKTDFMSNSGGWNINNVSLNAIIKKEEYLGVVFKPEVKSVVFINRGVADIFERHAILSELKTTNDIDTNRGGKVRI